MGRVVIVPMSLPWGGGQLSMEESPLKYSKTDASWREIYNSLRWQNEIKVPLYGQKMQNKKKQEKKKGKKRKLKYKELVTQNIFSNKKLIKHPHKPRYKTRIVTPFWSKCFNIAGLFWNTGIWHNYSMILTTPQLLYSNFLQTYLIMMGRNSLLKNELINLA